jgi:carbonic anhydrase/acetyltransferase-like protein (isoleucine patch superfamily)
MAIIKEIRGYVPKIGKDCFIAETAAVIGDVTMGDNCSIWYSTVLRGDVNSISIGNNVNIQDGAVVHTLFQRSKTTIGDNVSIGHNATIHGATIESNSLIGMGATILDNAVVESGAIVAANALVTSGMRVEGGWIYAGVPAKKIKEVSKEQQKDIVERIANDYIMYSSWYKNETESGKLKAES